MTSKLAILALMAALQPEVAAAVTEPSPAKLLTGRTAGAPIQCLSSFQRDQGTQLYADGSIAYEGRGSTWYINKPDRCPTFRSDMAIVSVTPSDQLCRGDIIRVVDPTSGIFYGSCSLGEFVPYGRAK